MSANDGVSIFERLREEVSLAEVAGSYTNLEQTGAALRGRCPHPDHEDKNPSFYVYPDHHFHCFGCNRHGDVTDLYAAVNNVSAGFEAAERLAKEFGVEIPELDSEAQQKAVERREKEARCFADATEAHDALSGHPEIVEWWEGRGFSPELCERFLLGADGDSATIPLWNRGRIHGLIRRKLEGEPKYLLPKNEELVRGHKPLFAPVRLSGPVLLVEGYVDALALCALGFCGIAVGGTNMSADQASELRSVLKRSSCAPDLYILPDRDEAGADAARKWLADFYPDARLCPPNYGGHGGNDGGDEGGAGENAKTSERKDQENRK